MTFSDEIRSASRIEPAPGERPLWEGHRERLRRRMEREGWDALKPHEMVELALYPAVPRQDLSDISRLLVDRFGSVGGVFGASREQLLAVPGMTRTLAEWVALTGELMRAYWNLRDERDIRVGNFVEVLAFLKPRLAGGGEAGSMVFYADFNFNLIACVRLPRVGSWWDGASVRGMLKDAIGCGARYVFLVLRRDDGLPELDEEESARLEAFACALRGADIDLVDCVVAARGELKSMNLEGRMAQIRARSGCLALHERYGEGL